MYEKLKNIDKSKPVKLVECMPTALCCLTGDFIEYDTTFYDDGKKDNYPLKEGQYLILFFVDCNGTLFTTIRRQTPSKTEYYMTSIGCEFELIINYKYMV
jgi:hypothetical protein